ncbi:hypothetical protein ZWY2020_056122 [Hordeum vulgare]|nr:hypothetical protein ZWY2020_056122 [Hordeum vulgare]
MGGLLLSARRASFPASAREASHVPALALVEAWAPEPLHCRPARGGPRVAVGLLGGLGREDGEGLRQGDGGGALVACSTPAAVQDSLLLADPGPGSGSGDVHSKLDRSPVTVAGSYCHS